MNNYVQLYTIWPGRNRFCCKGKFMTGPSQDCCSNFYTWLCICGVGVPYIIFVTPILWNEISPALSLPTYFLFVSTIFFLLLTQFSDPGIIPRREIIKLINDKNLLEFIDQELINSVHVEGAQAGFDDLVHTYEARFKTCTTCNIIRPVRSAHCGSCNNCVAVHDHHCPFVNNCVGKNNYRFFISFIVSVCALAVSVVTGMICFLVLMGSQNLNNDSKSIILIVFLVPIGISGLCVFGLCSYHIYLRCIGKTTRENLKNLNTNLSESEESHQFLWFSGSQTLFNPRQLVLVDTISIQQ